MSTETPKQKLRRVMGRLKLDDAKRRVIDKAIEEMPDGEAEVCVEWLDELEKEMPDFIERLAEELEKSGLPDD